MYAKKGKSKAIINMDKKTDFCNWLNSEIYSPNKNVIGEVKIPIYTSFIKKGILKILQYFFSEKIFIDSFDKKVSHKDFSKIIPADSWKIYEVDLNNKIALPQFVREDENSWIVGLVHEFFKEDLQYGVRPITIYFKIFAPGTGPILVDKSTQNIYNIGSGIESNFDYINDFALYKKGQKTKLDWTCPPYVK